MRWCGSALPRMTKTRLSGPSPTPALKRDTWRRCGSPGPTANVDAVLPAPPSAPDTPRHPATCLRTPHSCPGAKQAIKRGYASSLVVPLKEGDKVFGAITIYSREPDTFAEGEVSLLTELAGDLAYGIGALRMRAAHAQAEEERETTVEFLRLVNQSRGTGDLIQAATTFFQQRSGCEAVGIRLQEGTITPISKRVVSRRSLSGWRTASAPGMLPARSSAITAAIPPLTACAATSSAAG